MQSNGYGLGRQQKEDWNDLRYMARGVVVPQASERNYRYWNQTGWWGDQNGWPECVAFACVHILEDGPETQPGTAPIVNPRELYAECKRRDGIPHLDGTYGRVAAAILQERGFVKTYRWFMNAEEIGLYILENGPVAVGTNWYRGMTNPEKNILRLTGPVDGGHEYVLNGYNRIAGLFRVKNSWGRTWARNGNAWLQGEDLERLIVAEHGDAMAFTEK